MSTKPMLRRRGSIAEVMNALSSGSSSSRSVCGLGTLTSAISNSFARAREMRASSRVLISPSFIGVFRFVSSIKADPVDSCNSCGICNDWRHIVPSLACGGGTGRGHALKTLASGGDAKSIRGRFPLPTPPPQAGEGAHLVRGVASVLLASRDFGAAPAEPLLHARPQHQEEAEREDRRGQRPQDEDGVIVIRNHQRLMERALREFPENEPDDQADQRIAVTPQEIAE